MGCGLGLHSQLQRIYHMYTSREREGERGWKQDSDAVVTFLSGTRPFFSLRSDNGGQGLVFLCLSLLDLPPKQTLRDSIDAFLAAAIPHGLDQGT